MKIETESIRQSKDQFDRDDYGTKEMSEQTVLERKKGGCQDKNRRKEKVLSE